MPPSTSRSASSSCTSPVEEAVSLTVGALPASPRVADAIALALREDVPGLLGEMGYDPFGLPRLRAGLAAHMTRQGVPTDPDEILVTSGAQQAVHLIASAFGGPGTAVAMENPTYIGAIDAFRTTGNRLIPIPVDADGPRIEVLGPARGGRPVASRLRRPDLPQPDRRDDAGRAATRAGPVRHRARRARSSRT